MKKLTLIVHADVQQALADALRALPEVREFIFAAVEGHGPQDEVDAALSARDRVVGYSPHVRVDILLEDDQLDAVFQALRQGGSGTAITGVYWIVTIQSFGRL